MRSETFKSHLILFYYFEHIRGLEALLTSLTHLVAFYYIENNYRLIHYEILHNLLYIITNLGYVETLLHFDSRLQNLYSFIFRKLVLFSNSKR